MKPLVLRLFENVNVIRIRADIYPFDVSMFLEVIRSVEIPKSLESIIIEYKTDWFGRQMDKEMIKEFAAENIHVEYGRDGDPSAIRSPRRAILNFERKRNDSAANQMNGQCCRVL